MIFSHSKMLKSLIVSLILIIDFRIQQCCAFQTIHLPLNRNMLTQRSMAAKSEDVLRQAWLPLKISDDDSSASVENRLNLQRESIDYMASLIRFRLENGEQTTVFEDSSETKSMILCKDRFRDLTCSYEGELSLERLFDTRGKPDLQQEDENVIRGAIIALQSLLIMGMRTGVKGNKEQMERMVAHLKHPNEESKDLHRISLDRLWNTSTQRSLKHKADTTAGVQLLAALKRKRTNQGALDLLVQIGAWTKHEDIALLRSGFPTRFTADELAASAEALGNTHDPDHLLGIRKDLRHLKVYTIDDKSTYEIDDGLSIEKIKKSDGSEGMKIWIHISDADRWAPRDSDIFNAAKERVTSLYLPTGSIPMFPTDLSAGPMSLRAGYDSCAISLGLELNNDGSINESTLEITPSLLNIDYRLTYDDVDEMLELGIGYFEEWELGALLDKAKVRRKYRIRCGSTEGFVPNPIPKAELKVVPDDDLNDVRIHLNVEVTHNAGFNSSSIVLDSNTDVSLDFAMPVSSAFMLVTEMMVMAGEAMGKLKGVLVDDREEIGLLDNTLSLPYRTQPRPDFRRRYQELNTLETLKNKGYCHAWYARRFFEPVQVQEDPLPHCGLGLECYVQWTSPIRRFSDLQVHAAVKRFLRRRRVNELISSGKSIPNGLKASDLGCTVPLYEECMTVDGTNYKHKRNVTVVEDPIDYRRGFGFVNAARVVQRKSEEYWMFELIRRKVEENETEMEFEATILACIDPSRKQYAIYINGWGFEHRYLSEKGDLAIGETIALRVASVNPRLALLTFSLSSKYGGRPVKFVAQAA